MECMAVLEKALIARLSLRLIYYLRIRFERHGEYLVLHVYLIIYQVEMN